MNIRTVKKSERRWDSKYNAALNIQSWDRDNLYPQRMLQLVLNSSTGSTCLERYQTFIEGNGFKDKDFADTIINRRGDTVDDIYKLIARDLALYHGFAIHVNYNLMCDIVEMQHVPFQDCRLEEEADDGSVIYINVHPDWEGKKTRKGKTILVDKDNVQKVYVFNPNKTVVLAQIEAVGGIENYNGQILWYSVDGRYVYPRPIYDKVVTALSTDEGLDNVKYRNVRNNFLLAGMFIRKKGATVHMDENGQMVQSTDDDVDEGFSDTLSMFQGDTNTCSIMEVTVNADEDKPEFVTFEGGNFDKKFDSTETSTVTRIYSAFGQEPWCRIRDGRLGFSQDVLSEAYEYYNSFVTPRRKAISTAFKKICSHWFEEINESKEYSIIPLIYYNNYLTYINEYGYPTNSTTEQDPEGQQTIRHGNVTQTGQTNRKG